MLGDDPDILEALLLPTVISGLELEEKKLQTTQKRFFAIEPSVTAQSQKGPVANWEFDRI